jgi:hypothetical protein
MKIKDVKEVRKGQKGRLRERYFKIKKPVSGDDDPDSRMIQIDYIEGSNDGAGQNNDEVRKAEAE